MIQIVSTESGEPTLKVDRRFVHSRRNPSTEATRFFESELGSRPCRTVLIVGAGLGYLTREARRSKSGCRTVAIHLSSASRVSAVELADDVWDPSGSERIETFLERVLGEEELSGLLTLFWRPALAAFPDEAQRAQTAVQEHISRLNASLATTGYFGPRWFRNGIANYVNVSSWRKLDSVDAPVVVAAPGPNLGESVQAIRVARSQIVLVAVASALHPLAFAGLSPDLVVHQDAGFFSGEHFRPRRNSAVEHIAPQLEPFGQPLVQPLSARPLPQRYRDWDREQEQSVVWLRYDHPLDELLRRHGSDAALAMPQLGTVTATAIRLALQLTTEQVFLAGVDMASWDVLSHARGHVFDEYHASAAGRLHPQPTTRVARLATSAKESDSRTHPWRSTEDLSIYAAWFRSVSQTQRLRRLAPSGVDIGVPEAHTRELTERARTRAPGSSAGTLRSPADLFGTPVSAPPRRIRLEHLSGLIHSWAERAKEFRPSANADFAEAPSSLKVLARHLAMAEVLRTERAAPDGREEVVALRDRLRATLKRVRTFLEVQRESVE